MLQCCFRNQKYELEQRQSSAFYRTKAYDRMKYRIRDGPWVKLSYVINIFVWEPDTSATRHFGTETLWHHKIAVNV